MSDEKPAHPAVEGPESLLEEVRHPEEIPEAERDLLADRAAELETELEAIAKEKEALGKEKDALAAKERELTERLVRLQADFDNFRRRSREDVTNATARGKEALLRAFLPILDNLERAAAHSEDEGIRLLARQVTSTLAAENIEVIDPAGAMFDAARHEAIAQGEKEGAASGTILEVAERGYAYDGKVVRPARVVVVP